MLTFLYDFVVNYPGITYVIVFGIFMYVFRTTRKPYQHGD